MLFNVFFQPYVTVAGRMRKWYFIYSE